MTTDEYRFRKRTEEWEREGRSEPPILIEDFVNDIGEVLVEYTPPWEKIYDNCEVAKKLLEEIGGKLFWGHYLLSESRDEVEIKRYDKPVEMGSTFTTLFYIPANSVRLHSGYTIRGEEQEPVDSVARSLPSHTILANLGFYVSPNLRNRYNDLLTRKAIYHEQLNREMLPFLGPFSWEEDGQIYTGPPLFGRSFVSWGDDGISIIPFFKLGRGYIEIEGKRIEWNEDDVNDPHPGSKPVVIYTPYFHTEESKKCEERLKEDPNDSCWKNYLTYVGEDRINLVVTNRGNGEDPVNEIIHGRYGEVVLPPCGVVVSLSEEESKRVLGIEVEEGEHLDTSSLKHVNFNLNLPSGIRGYGGLIPLVIDGKDYTKNNDDLVTIFQKASLYHPYSVLMQESPIHRIDQRQPRSGLFLKDGYIGMIIVSGRNTQSIGATYSEMVRICHDLVGEVKWFVALDSGSASKLFLKHEDDQIYMLNLTSIGPRTLPGESGGFANWIGFSFHDIKNNYNI